MDKALNQYLDIYSQHKDLICDKSAFGFNALRQKAYESLSVEGLPKKGSENYEVVDIPSMLAPDYGLNIGRIPLDVNVREAFKCGLPQLASSLFFLLNDSWAESKGARLILPDGIEIGPLSSYLGKGGEAVGSYGKLADLANPLVALNTMLVQEGVYIKVKKGVRIDRPIQFVDLLDNGVPLMALRRFLIILEEDSSLKLLVCDHTNSTGHEMASSTVVEVFAGRNSSLEFYEMEESGEKTRRLSTIYLQQEEGSRVLMESFTLRNGITRNEYHCLFEGKNAELKLCGIGIESAVGILDNYSHIRHEASHCRTEELFKYILEDESKGQFTGKILVAPGAEKTEAYQNNRNLVGSEKAKMFSKPQLEIYNDDVKCSHGSATGQLDAIQLFYMRSRGLTDAEARLLLKQAFMADVIEEVKLPILRDRLHNLIERRFVGEDVKCGECGVCGSASILEN